MKIAVQTGAKKTKTQPLPLPEGIHRHLSSSACAGVGVVVLVLVLVLIGAGVCSCWACALGLSKRTMRTSLFVSEVLLCVLSITLAIAAVTAPESVVGPGRG